MGSLNGGGFGFPVTYSILFDGLQVLTADAEAASGDASRSDPWGVTVPTGYDLYIVAIDLTRYMGAPTAGSLSTLVRNGDTDEAFGNTPSPQLIAGGAGWSFDSVSAGACRVPQETPIRASIYTSSDFAHNWSAANVRMNIYGYLREAITE